MEELTKYKDAYLSEAREHIEAMNDALLKFEKSPASLNFVSDIFRAAHTLKSMSAAMDYHKTSQLCHVVEDVLDAVRKKKIKAADCIDLLFECFDVLELTLKQLRKNKEEMDTDELAEKLRSLAAGNRPEITDHRPETTDTEFPAPEKIQAIEVKVERLDLLMNLAEELLISKMRLDKIKVEVRSPELSAAVDSLGRLVSEIQYNVMQSRLVPVGFVFNRFPRMVRDLAKQQKKEVNLQIEGADTELDRTVVDEIGEGMVHLLRNAVDHGIELPQERQKAGKPAAATIRLSATQTKSFVTIFSIEIPLTLAIVKSLFVKVGGKAYAIPMANIERLVVVKSSDIKGMVDNEAIVLNEEDILITRLDSLFGEPLLNLEKQPIVIVWKGRERLGLAVDELMVTQEIVIKPLNKLVKENRYFSGSTIIGSGEAVLILDVANLMLSKRS